MLINSKNISPLILSLVFLTMAISACGGGTLGTGLGLGKAGGTVGTGIGRSYGGTNGSPASSGLLRGKIKSLQGMPLAGVQITVVTTVGSFKSVTDKNGAFYTSISGVGNGPVKLLVEGKGVSGSTEVDIQHYLGSNLPVYLQVSSDGAIYIIPGE